MENKISIAWLTLNRACNLRCEWCYAKMTEFDQSSTMSLSTAKHIIDILSGHELESVILIGGEPTIHPNFFEILAYLNSKNIKARLVTNGLRFADVDFVKKCLDYDLYNLAISFKAPNREKYIKVTGKDVFDKTCVALKNIVDSGIGHSFNLVACDDFLDEIDEYIRIAKEYDVQGVFVDTGKPVILDGKSYVDGFADPREMARIIQIVYNKLNEAEMRFSVKMAVPFCLFPEKFVEQCLEEGKISTGCQMMYGNGVVFDPLGKIIPCNHLCDISMGQVGKELDVAEDFDTYISIPKIKKYFDQVRACPAQECVDCKYWKECGAGCRMYWLSFGKDKMLENFT